MLQQKANNSAAFFNLGIIALFLIQLFVFSPETLDEFEESKQLPIVVPYITYSSNALLFLSTAFSLLFFFYVILKRKNEAYFYDRFSVFLLCRLIFGVLQVLLLLGLGVHIGFGNYMIYVFEFLIYRGCLLSFNPKHMERFLTIINICVFVIALETIYQSVIGILPQISYVMPWYKSNMVIPFGGSNTLATIIFPIWAAQLFVKKPEEKFRLVFLLVLTVALILTKSRFAMLLMILILIKIMMSYKNTFVRVLAFLSLFGLGFLVLSNLELASTLFSGFSDEVSKGGTANKLSSGRMSYFSMYIDGFLQSPIIGYGPTYEESRAHNIIIDVLYQNGILGLILFISAIVYVLKGSKKNSQSPVIGYELQYTRVIVIVYLIQSLGEISYFTYYISDLMFLPCIAFLSLNKRYKYNLILSR